jgi:hypothetical protein
VQSSPLEQLIIIPKNHRKKVVRRLLKNIELSLLCNQERLSPELVSILCSAARYRRATVCSSHDDAHPDNSALHTGKILLFSAAHQQICSSPAATASRRRGNDLGTKFKFLQKKTSDAAGIGLGATR